MKFDSPLVEARFIQRYKRFLSDFELPDGTLVTAHCANPGSMRSCLVPGARCWLTLADNPKRKLKYTWQVAEVDGIRVFVNPALANDIVVAGIRSGVVAELCDYSVLEREVRVGTHSRIDIVLRGPATTCFVEVKNVTLALTGGRTAFPDSVTARGTKHLRELIELTRQGYRSVLVFCAAREDAQSVEPADEIDPVYGRALRQAVESGVEVLAYRCIFTPQAVRLERRVPVLIS